MGYWETSGVVCRWRASERAGTSSATFEETVADTQVLLVTWQLVNIVHGIMGLSFDYDYKPWHGILFYLVSSPFSDSTRCSPSQGRA